MTLPIPVPILCACGWTGRVLTRGLCGGCGARHTHRVSPDRLAWLRAIAAGTHERPPPMTIRWLRERGLVGEDRRVTVAGERVIVAAQLAERVARHAGMEES